MTRALPPIGLKWVQESEKATVQASHWLRLTRWHNSTGGLEGGLCIRECAKMCSPPVRPPASQGTTPCCYMIASKFIAAEIKVRRELLCPLCLEETLGAVVPRDIPLGRPASQQITSQSATESSLTLGAPSLVQ